MPDAAQLQDPLIEVNSPECGDPIRANPEPETGTQPPTDDRRLSACGRSIPFLQIPLKFALGVSAFFVTNKLIMDSEGSDLTRCIASTVAYGFMMYLTQFSIDIVNNRLNPLEQTDHTKRQLQACSLFSGIEGVAYFTSLYVAPSTLVSNSYLNIFFQTCMLVFSTTACIAAVGELNRLFYNRETPTEHSEATKKALAGNTDRLRAQYIINVATKSLRPIEMAMKLREKLTYSGISVVGCEVFWTAFLLNAALKLKKNNKLTNLGMSSLLCLKILGDIAGYLAASYFQAQSGEMNQQEDIELLPFLSRQAPNITSTILTYIYFVAVVAHSPQNTVVSAETDTDERQPPSPPSAV